MYRQTNEVKYHLHGLDMKIFFKAKMMMDRSINANFVLLNSDKEDPYPSPSMIGAQINVIYLTKKSEEKHSKKTAVLHFGCE